MSKPPLSLVSRCRPPPSSPPRRANISSVSATDKSQSRILAALTSMDIDDARNSLVEANKPRLHPFFRAATTPAVEPRARAPPLNATRSRSLPSSTAKRTLVRVSQPTATAQASALTPPLTLTEPIDAEVPLKLPVYSYKSLSPAPQMRFTRSEADADKWVKELDHTGPISVDLEWAVAFRKGTSVRPVSLVQLADNKNIIVIQLRTKTGAMGRFPRNLQRLLEDPNIPKMGANIMNDAKKIFKDYGVMMANVVELGSLARQADPACAHPTVWGRGKKIVSLAKLVERYLQKTLSKEADIRVSDWEDPKLEAKREHLEYAANDVFCGLEVYNHLMALAKSNAIKLDPTKYTDKLHHERLSLRHPPSPTPSVSTTPTPPADPTSPLPLPVIHYTDDMRHANISSQSLRAYRHWLAQRDIDTMCKELRLNATEGQTLKRSTLITYVVTAIENWPEFQKNADFGALRLLIQMDLMSWERHFKFLESVAIITQDPKTK